MFIHHNTKFCTSVSRYLSVGAAVFLRWDLSPSSVGLPGSWIKTAFYLTDSSYRVIQRDGDNTLRAANYTSGDNQQWHFSALNGDGNEISEFSMWVRTG